jgi:hypothetical protein
MPNRFRFLAVLLLPGCGPWLAQAALPVTGSAGQPALLLELGSAPASLAAPAAGVLGIRGTVSGHDASSAVSEQADEVVSSHPGFGRWETAFRFGLEPLPASGPYTFWARWRQGGEPSVCEQRFELWAGPDAARLQRRAELRLKPRGWDYAWLAAEPQLSLGREDAVLEIRVSGAGHDAKVFDAFLLGPPPPAAALPVTPSRERPVLALELGTAPPRRGAPGPAGLEVTVGRLTEHSGQGGLIEEKDEIQVLHPRFGEFGAGFRFALPQRLEPGQYRFHARYKSGGEVSQVAQRFSVKLGADEASLAERAGFTLSNGSPWEYQWLAGEGTVPVFPGDRWVQVDNTGKADGAKVFDGFLLQFESAATAPMKPADAAARNRFLAGLKTIAQPVRRLYVLDDGSAAGQALFAGLSPPEVQRRLADTAVIYKIGPEAQALARELNLSGLPAAALADAQYSLLGVLAQPGKPAEVARFLDDPRRHGMLPAIPAEPEPPSLPLRDGIPPAWLVGGLQDGIAGLSIYGMDSETVMRPNPGERYLGTELMGGVLRTWQRADAGPDGAVVIADTGHDYRWAGGSGYAQVYLKTARPTRALLNLERGGESGGVWLDGREIAPRQGSAALDLSPGWHRLLLKWVMKLGPGESFGFSARFIGADGKPLEGVETRIADPTADLARNRVAARLRPLVYVEVPANLPRAGDPLKLRVDLRWHELEQERGLAAPIPAFPARLKVEIRDYRGHPVALRELDGVFPSATTLDFGKAPEPGYYAVYASLADTGGRPIMAYPADGFTVVGGNSAQRERLADKKLWNNYYYAFADGDRGFRQAGGYFDWLERSGIFQGYGSYPGAAAGQGPLWDEARRRGLVLFADTGGDSHWLNDDAQAGAEFIARSAAHTRYFKANNEIDIRREGEWAKLRSPAHWVERARREFEAVHRARPDGHYVGGSLVRPGDLGGNSGYPDGLGPGRWFEQVLKLGLDRYLDAWDVHAYPQRPPHFGGPIGNADSEDERGVLAAYARLGRRNVLPFWLGEAGAKAAHGGSGRRWQAEQTAKMIAWVNSRSDYKGLAFCLGHEYDLGQGRLWDYSMGHKPGEAALYTAGALIDGLPYRAVETGDDRVQAGRFGPTLMAWRTDAQALPWQIRLDASQRWVMVDVVGRREALAVPKEGLVAIELGGSPAYVLPEPEYRRLVGP